MKVVCVKSKASADQVPWSADREYVDYSITPGKSYIVYGIGIDKGFLQYLICAEDYTYYPLFVPASMFDAPEGSLPAGLEMTNYGNIEGVCEDSVLSLSAFRTNPYFYDQLTDGDDEDVLRIWNEFKAKVEAYEEG